MLLAVPEFLIISLWFLFITAFTVTVFSLKNMRDKRRTREMESQASGLGLSFSDKDQEGLIKQLKDFDLFSREKRAIFRKGRISNVMRSKMGDTEIFLFDYTYVISTGKTTRTIAQTVFFANDKNWYLPNFILKPESWWHKVIKFFGGKDIDFADNPEFSEKFWVEGDTRFESLIRNKFSPEVQKFLLERPPVHIEGNNYYLIAYRPKSLLHPEATQPFLEHCKALTQLFKSEDKMELLDLAELKKEEIRLENDQPLK